MLILKKYVVLHVNYAAVSLSLDIQYLGLRNSSFIHRLQNRLEGEGIFYTHITKQTGGAGGGRRERRGVSPLFDLLCWLAVI
jgi:hypothetical protein